MIDIETLGRRADAAILQIGVVAFNILSGEIIESQLIKIRESEWASNNRTFTGETFVWWMNQSKEAQQNLLGGELSQREALKWLSYFIDKHQHENCRIWTKGTMDLDVLKSLYDDLGIERPWKYWQPRDMLTLYDVVPVLKVTPDLPHSALDDAIAQAKQLSRSYLMLINRINSNF